MRFTVKIIEGCEEKGVPKCEGKNRPPLEVSHAPLNREIFLEV
jgi:hypothetical protein